MSEENNNYRSRVPEFDAVSLLQQRLAQKTSNNIDKRGLDPYDLMVKRNKENRGEVVSDQPVQKWPEEDLKKLEDFCRKMGIVGFSAGNMSPLAALAFLKQKLGVIEEFPRTEGYGPNYPYTEAVKKRTLLHG